MRRSIAPLGVSLLLATILMAGCASTPDPASSPAEPTQSAMPSIAELAAAPGVTNIVNTVGGTATVDYDALPTTESMAELSTVVVTGTLEEIQPGPTFGIEEDDFSDIRSVALKLGNVEVLHGELVTPNDGYFYVGLIDPLGEILANPDVIPRGSKIVSYSFPSKGEESPLLFNASDGRPEGEVLYGTAHPQGFAIEVDVPDGSSGSSTVVVWPFTGAVEAGELSQAFPGGPAAGIEPSRL